MKFCPQCERDLPEDVEVCPDDGTPLVSLTSNRDTLIGRTIDGRYTLEARLGEGGMGAVYVATQEAVGRKVAVKILRRDLTDDAASIKRFFHEAKVVSRLRHPNTVTLYDFGQSEEGLLYIAMEYMTGQRLDTLLEAQALTLPEVVEVMDQVCESLAEAHELGIVHRDLKPENIFVDTVGRRHIVKVLDFGIAKVPGLKTNLTLTGMVFGTPAYMSPEQAQGFELDHRSDLYSLGVMLWELLCGRLPFDGDSAMRVAMSHILSPVPDVRKKTLYRPLPPGLAELVTALLSKQPDARPSTAEAVRDKLRQVARALEDLPETARRPRRGLRLSMASGRQPAETATGVTGARVALRERITAPSTRQALEPPDETGPRSSEVYVTSDYESSDAIPRSVFQSRAPRRLALAVAALAVIVTALWVTDTVPFDTPPSDIAAPDPPQPNTRPAQTTAPTDDGGELSRSPSGSDVVAAAESTPPPLDPERLSRANRRNAGLATALWAALTPGAHIALSGVGGALALTAAEAPEETSERSLAEPSPGSVVLTTVTIHLDLQPADAEVRLASDGELVCQGDACAAVDLPTSLDPIELLVSRRRYEDRVIQLTPDRERAVTAHLERQRPHHNDSASEGSDSRRAEAEIQPTEPEAAGTPSTLLDEMTDTSAEEGDEGGADDEPALRPVAEPPEPPETSDAPSSPLMNPITLPQ